MLGLDGMLDAIVMHTSRDSLLAGVSDDLQLRIGGCPNYSYQQFLGVLYPLSGEIFTSV